MLGKKRRKRYTPAMAEPYLDRLAGPERERVIKRLRSPEAYERLREKVKGPEDLESALEQAEKMAELHFALESNRESHDRLKSFVGSQLREQGIDALLESPRDVSNDARDLLREGKFSLSVSPHEETNDDVLMIVPEGNDHEKIPLKISFVDACVSQVSKKA